MSTHTTENRFSHLQTTHQLQKRQSRGAFCRCFQLKDFFCDDTHKTLPTKVGPIIVELVTLEEKQ